MEEIVDRLMSYYDDNFVIKISKVALSMARASINKENCQNYNRFLPLLFNTKINELMLLIDKDSELYSDKIYNLIKEEDSIPKIIDIIEDHEFNNPIWIKYREKEKKRESVLESRKGNSNVRCAKCGKRNTEVTFAQTRSADEGMTQFFTCLECNNKWKKS